MMNDKKNFWTGERLETFITNETMTEHLHRYAIAIDIAKGKDVLDIACGEGYGSLLLSKSALYVAGIDIDNKTISQAKNKYKKDNLEFFQGDILQIPMEDERFDIITCFETVEHLSDHNTILKELKRVLKPSGILLISTPDKAHYSDKTGYRNPYHHKELYETEFKQLLRNYFLNTAFFLQTSMIGSVMMTEDGQSLQNFFSGDYNTIQKKGEISPMYWVGIASDNSLPDINSSLFQSLTSVAEIQENQNTILKKSLTYRIGNFILSPVKFIFSILKK